LRTLEKNSLKNYKTVVSREYCCTYPTPRNRAHLVPNLLLANNGEEFSSKTILQLVEECIAPIFPLNMTVALPSKITQLLLLENMAPIRGKL